MSTLIVAPALSLADRIAHRRKIARMQEFQILGRLCVMLFDPNGMERPKPAGPVFQPNLLDWLDKGPWLGESCDGQDLLLISSVEHPPDIPDTRTFPATMWPQKYTDRTRARLKEFLVIQPVAQMTYKPKGIATYAHLRAKASRIDGTHMAFMINPETGEGHLIGGEYEISVR